MPTVVDDIACTDPECSKRGVKGAGNVVLLWTYGPDAIRFLLCRECKTRFSERRGTPTVDDRVWDTGAVVLRADRVGAQFPTVATTGGQIAPGKTPGQWTWTASGGFEGHTHSRSRRTNLDV